MEISGFEDILKSEMRAKGLNAQKLSELTDIAPVYIKSLLEGEFETLPAAPYIRGYIQRISDVLEIDFDGLWSQYKRESDLKTSGYKDKLPTNRFASQPINKKLIIGIVAVLLVLGIAIPKLADFFGTPTLEIISPAQDNITTDASTFILKGRVGNPQDKVLVNDDEVIVNSDGTFEKEVTLNGSKNDFQFTAKRFLGKEVLLTRTIIYEPKTQTGTEIIIPPDGSASSSTPSPTSTGQ